MTENRINNYEGMFLLSQTAVADLAGATDTIRGMIAKAEGEIIAMSKWDDRRLAYEIKGQKRGTYILVYFSCPAAKVAVIERDCNLSDDVLREIIIRADHLTLEEMQATDAQAELATEAALRAEESRVAAEKAAAAAEAEAAAAEATAEETEETKETADA